MQDISKSQGVFFSTQTGRCTSVLEMPSSIFSKRTLGDGVVIVPSENEILSPVNGKITQIANTNQAFFIKSDDDIEIIIYVGNEIIDEEKAFECFVKKGDKIKTGDKIASVDIKLLSSKGYELHTAVIITNCSCLETLTRLYGEVTAGKNEILRYTKKI